MLKVNQVEPTPNPNALKFIVDQTLSSNGVMQFDNPTAGESNTLAKALFSLDGVDSVFYSDHFVTVSKTEAVQWQELKPKVIEIIQSQNPPESQKGSPQATAPAQKASGDELLDQINDVINQNVRPALAGDGGGLEILSLDGHILTIHYQGACGTCPSAAQGTIMAIQNLLRATVDPRIQVVSDQY